MDTPNTFPTLVRRLPRHYLFSDGTLVPVISGGDGTDPDPTLSELIAQAANLAELDDEALAQLETDLVAAAEAVANGDLDDQALADLEAAATAVTSIRTEQDARTQAAAELADRAAAALALVRGAGEGDGDGEGDEGEAEGEGEPEGEDTPPPVVEGTEGEPEQTPEQIAAAAPPAPRRRPLTRLATRRPASAAPRVTTSTAASPFAGTHIVASANAPGLPSGQRVNSYDDLARGFVAAVKASRNYQGPANEIPIFTIGRGLEEYPESHRLDGNRPLNMERIGRAQQTIRAAGGLQAALRNGVTAAGGICAPSEVRYDLPGISATDARPLRDGFTTRFGADRGGVRTLPGIVIEDLNGASSWWTEADDISATDGNPTKSCMRIDCDNDETETVIEAAVQCLIYGNFMAAYFRERIERFMELLSASHARLAELRLLAAVTAGATHDVTIGQQLGTVRDLLAGLDRIRAVWNYRHRTPDNFTLQIALPRWLRDNIRTDVTRQLPVGGVTDTLSGLTDAQIDGLILARGFEPTWLLDGETGQRFNQQGDGPLQGWPTTVKTKVAPAGTWLHLDGGELNLGVMRDTTTTTTNDVQFFAETMENVHFHGVEAWNVDFDICPDGSVSGTVDINPCTTGS